MTTASNIEVGKLFFEEGIPGFSHLRFFRLLQEESDGPIYTLHSMEDEQISFWLVDPFAFFREYEFILKDHVKDELKINEETHVMVLTITTLRPNNQITVNLTAPLVINMDNKMAKQVILDDERYNVRHPLFQLSSKSE